MEYIGSKRVAPILVGKGGSLIIGGGEKSRENVKCSMTQENS